ncbi:hypothetical protein GCM10011583_17890 [Streptomyces camponoticapitis]|uniref:Uncharacterized protein n=1 Tax=Streptomyces camponoticapitis TaxID=1616125 RepID=A0ABQ2E4Y2_9ACTN|nr:hypothetical protein [Streptomyces camponoticapitis]GGJ86752.1 hypothetical protein GCM10011583_17890 [Streptomyces camponoticapitis]
MASLVSGLSPQAATRTALRDGLPEPTGQEVLLADVFDAVTSLDFHFSSANSDPKKGKLKPPKPYPRWWVTQSRARKNSPERVAKIEDARRRKREREQAIAEGRIA